MKNLTLKTGALAVAAAVSIALTAPAQAVDFSGKKVTLLVPYGEGGGSDTIARLFQPHLEKHLPGNPTVVVLNQPGGGGVKGSNKFDAAGPKDGTMLIVASSSGHLSFALGGTGVNFDETKWRGVMGLPRGAVIYTNAEQTGAMGKDPKADVAAMKKANVINGSKTPIAVELLDTTTMEMLGIDNKSVFGLSTSKQRQAFWRGEINLNNDGSGVYSQKVATAQEGAKATPLFTYGAPTEDGGFERDPDHMNLPTFPEFYEAAMGKKPSGTAFEVYKNLFAIKVALSKALALPAGTPQDIVDAWVTAMKKTYEDPSVKKALAKSFGGMKPTFGKATERALAEGLKISDESKAWMNDLLKKKYNASL